MEYIRPFGQLPELKRGDYNKEFSQFVTIDKLFTIEEVNSIKSLWNENKTFEGRVKTESEEHVDYEVRKSKIFYIDPIGNEWIYDKIAMAAIITNSNMYKFDINGFHTKLQLAQYTKDDFFGWHLDIGPKNTSLRKLSISIQLSSEEEYQGGDLQFLKLDDHVSASKSIGSAIIFPSYIYHRVAPVTSGVRKSLVAWIAGPPYR